MMEEKKAPGYAIQLTKKRLEHFKEFCKYLKFELKECGDHYEVHSNNQTIEITFGQHLVIYEETDLLEVYDHAEFEELLKSFCEGEE